MASEEEQVGIKILQKVCFAPATAIANNCGREGNVVAEKIFESSEKSFGYNGLTDEFTDLIKAGVIDPVMVTKNALKNACSVAGLLLTTATLITDKPQPKKNLGMPEGGMPGMPGMGGMM